MRADLSFLKGKRILITQNAIEGIAGSENVTLELAVFLKGIGAEVKVFAWHVGYPMMSFFESAGVAVTVDDEDEFFDDCDFVWVHHQVIPRRILDNLGKPNTAQPYFLFFHMSAMKELSLEQPYVYELEEKIAAKILYVSPEVKNMLADIHAFANIRCPEDIFANPAPDEYMEVADNAVAKELKSLLIVSNHAPQEVLQAKEILESKGIKVDLFGADGQYTKITKQIIARYDAVLEIGKTTQYCLLAQKPVYIYDRFGGSGYLNDKNFKQAAETNFSGRGFGKKTAEQIADELIENFADANKFVKKGADNFKALYSLSNNIARVFSDLRKPEYKLTDNYRWYVLTAEKNMAERIRDNYRVNRELNELKARVGELEQDNIRLYERVCDSVYIRGGRNIKKVKRAPEYIKYKLKSLKQRAEIDKSRKVKLEIAEKNGFLEYAFDGEQVYLVRKDYKAVSELAVLTRLRNESLVLKDTLDYLQSLGGEIFAYDDLSTDNSFEILCEHPGVKVIISNLVWQNERMGEETRNRQALLESIRKWSKAEWIFCVDGDERITDFDMDRLRKLPENIDSVRVRLYDAYMTEGDKASFKPGDKLWDFRKYFGPEYRDILMFFRNRDYIVFQGLVAREPSGCKHATSMFLCQHYGKAISEAQWEEKCRYYAENFDEPYKTKWTNRMGKSVHTESDFGEPLFEWGDELFKNGKKI